MFPASFPTSVGTVVFRTVGCYKGQITRSGSANGIAAANAICTADRATQMPGLTCSAVKALMPFGAAGSDLVATLPPALAATKAVWGPQPGTFRQASQLALDWRVLLSGPLGSTLVESGVTTEQTFSVWTGWNATTGFAPPASRVCNAWTQSTSTLVTQTGSTKSKTRGWSASGAKLSCCSTRPFLCACFL